MVAFEGSRYVQDRNYSKALPCISAIKNKVK